jgi:hypothetical protein
MVFHSWSHTRHAATAQEPLHPTLSLAAVLQYMSWPTVPLTMRTTECLRNLCIYFSKPGAPVKQLYVGDVAYKFLAALAQLIDHVLLHAKQPAANRRGAQVCTHSGLVHCAHYHC